MSDEHAAAGRRDLPAKRDTAGDVMVPVDGEQLEFFNRIMQERNDLDRERIEQQDREREAFEAEGQRQLTVGLRALAVDEKRIDTWAADRKDQRAHQQRLYFGTIVVVALFIGILAYLGHVQSAIHVLVGAITLTMTWFAGRGNGAPRLPPPTSVDDE